MLPINLSKRVSSRLHASSPKGENLGPKDLDERASSFANKLSTLGAKSKLELLREKEAAREAAQFGTITIGDMRRRAESDIAEVRTDPVPSDLIDVYKWAESKGVSRRYVRALIKQKEGSLPLVGGTLAYGLEALEALWRYDYQRRREKGIKKSAAARYKAEKLKLALALFENGKFDNPSENVVSTLQALELSKTNFSLSEKLFSLDSELDELKEYVDALEIDNKRLSLESNRLIDKIIDESNATLTREAVLAQAQSKRSKGSQGKVSPIEEPPSKPKGKPNQESLDPDEEF